MTVTDLNEMRRQQAELTRKIAEAERDAREQWNTGLDLLRSALADGWGTLHETERKNVITITIRGQVQVSLGYDEPDYTGSLAAGWGSGVAAFDAIPPAAALTAFLRGLIEAEGA
jgi:hypothetical protein